MVHIIVSALIALFWASSSPFIWLSFGKTLGFDSERPCFLAHDVSFLQGAQDSS